MAFVAGDRLIGRGSAPTIFWMAPGLQRDNRLLNEFPQWLVKARTQGVLQGLRDGRKSALFKIKVLLT
jgi:hypothetical protein